KRVFSYVVEVIIRYCNYPLCFNRSTIVKFLSSGIALDTPEVYSFFNRVNGCAVHFAFEVQIRLDLSIFGRISRKMPSHSSSK
ncbi:hypothetical protein L9F63_023395, partial [Diploptera punctata]